MFNAVSDHRIRLGLDCLFDEAQKSKVCHPHCISSMIKLMKKDRETFTLDFIKLFGCTLIQNEKSPNTSKVIEFIAKFCCHLDEEESSAFVSNVINFAVEVSSKKQTIVRIRCCEFFSNLLMNMGPQAMIDDELFTSITNAMLQRLQDKLPSVRSKAVVALQRLQEPGETKCPVIKAYMYHLENDPSSDVRTKVLLSIAISTRTLPVIIGRSRDVSEFVRKAMYKAMAKLKFTRLRISHRQSLIVDGLNDRSQVVRDYVMDNLIPKWFDFCSGDYIKFLEILDVVTLQETIFIKLLNALFVKYPSSELIELMCGILNSDKVICKEKLTPETVTLWLYIVKYFNNPPELVVIDKSLLVNIMPTLGCLSNYIKSFVFEQMKEKSSVNTYILVFLLKLVLEFNLNDIHGCNDMLKTCQEVLMQPFISSPSVIAQLSQVLKYLMKDPDDRIKYITPIVNDILCPMDIDMDKAALGQDETIGTNQSLLEDKIEISAEAKEKILLLIVEYLKSSDVKKISSTLCSLIDFVVTPLLAERKSYILSLAISALSLACLLDVSLAKKNFIKICIWIDMGEDTSISALEAVFDLMLAHGLIDFFPNKEDAVVDEPSKDPLDLSNESMPPKLRHLFTRILLFFESPTVRVRSVAAMGFTKLFLAGIVRSPLILGRLISLWFNPDLGKDSWISQPLGMFFNYYSKCITSAGDVILKSFIPLLKHIIDAPSSSSTFLVSPSSVAEFIVTLLRLTLPHPPKNGASYHLRLAELICIEIIMSPVNSKVMPLIAKSLLHIDVKKSDEKYFPDFMPKLVKVIKKLSRCPEKSLENAVQSFYKKIVNLNVSVKDKKISEACDKSSINGENSELVNSRASKKLQRSSSRDSLTEDSRNDEDNKTKVSKRSSNTPDPSIDDSQSFLSKRSKSLITSSIKDSIIEEEEGNEELSDTVDSRLIYGCLPSGDFVPGTPQSSSSLDSPGSAENNGSDEDVFESLPIAKRTRTSKKK